MKIVSMLLFAMFLALTTSAASIEGNIKIARSSNGTTENAFKKQFGDVVKATTKWYAGEFFGTETVYAGVEVRNTGRKPMYYQYYVAFFDKDKKLIGATAQAPVGKAQGLKPNEEGYLASCLILLPKNKYKEIVSYQAVIYESDVAPDN